MQDGFTQCRFLSKLTPEPLFLAARVMHSDLFQSEEALPDLLTRNSLPGSVLIASPGDKCFYGRVGRLYASNYRFSRQRLELDRVG